MNFFTTKEDEIVLFNELKKNDCLIMKERLDNGNIVYITDYSMINDLDYKLLISKNKPKLVLSRGKFINELDSEILELARTKIISTNKTMWPGRFWVETSA